MKLISAAQNLRDISAGQSSSYQELTQGGAILGSTVLGSLGLIIAHYPKPTNLLISIAAPVTMATVGLVGGYLTGAVTYTMANNFGKVINTAFAGIDYIFAPA